MKKFSMVFAATIVLISFIFVGCSNNQIAETGRKSLYDHGLELVEVVEEMAKSEKYLEIYTGSPRISEVISEFGQGDYSVLQKVYKLTPTSDYLA